jgi:hypothetical protein
MAPVHLVVGVLLVLAGCVAISRRTDLAKRLGANHPRAFVASPTGWGVVGAVLLAAGIIQLLAGFTQLSNGS